MTSHYEERIEKDLTKIKSALLSVGSEARSALEKSVQALLNQDRRLSYETILGDNPINRAVLRIDRLCHAFVARHLPTARHLRFISSVLKMNIELERIGDYAVTICRESVLLTQDLESRLRREVERMARDSTQMLQQAMQAFEENNADLARGTMGYADQVERSFSAVFAELVAEGQAGGIPVKDLFGALVIFNMLERVSDQAKNMCEDTIFFLTGETKAPKVYRILFVDPGDCRAQMAVAIGQKAYPNSGEFSAGNLEPTTLDTQILNYLEEKGAVIKEESPLAVDWLPKETRNYNVIVSLDGPMQRYLKEVPFNTVALEWDIPNPLTASDPSERAELTEQAYKNIAARLRDLMELLRGEEAS